jgi:hypothetical protein
VECRWFSPGTPVSSTNKTDRHDITEILLKVALNTITLTLYKATPTKDYLSLSGQISDDRYDPDKLRCEEAKEAEEIIRLKQYVSLRSKGRHN